MFLVAYLCWVMNIASIRCYYQRCLKEVRSHGLAYDPQFLDCLYLAEDKRNAYHWGVDYLGVIRAMIANFKGGLQGASTIQQQFVRTVIGRYERTIQRKVTEQLVAHLLSVRVDRHDIAQAYLDIAFLGHATFGYRALLEQLQPRDMNLDFYCSVVAFLKYPKPIHPTQVWLEKHQKRSQWILNQHIKTFGNLIY